MDRVRGQLRALCGCLLLSLATATTAADEVTPPAEATLPQQQVDVSYPTPTGRLLQLNAEADLQVALNMAVPGDVIELTAGAVYKGPFRLPAKNGNGWIVIRSSGEAELPRPGTRVSPADAPAMAVLTAEAGSVILAAPGAHHYRFVGIEMRPEAGKHLDNLVLLSGGARSLQTMPHHIVFDRCYLHGDPKAGTRRGIALNTGAAAVVDSYLADFKARGVDSQAIAGWGGTGPYRISNNYLEGAGENVMFGGADPRIEGLVPADIEITGNHFAKPLSWKAGHPEFEEPSWTIKNLFELKNARRVLIEGNLFEYHWPQAQNGFSILFTVRNQEGDAPWSVVEDITFRNNVVRHVSDGINILGLDDNYPSRQTARIAIRNNLFTDLGGDWGRGRLLQLLRGVEDVVLENNTALNTGNIIFAEGAPSRRVSIRGNVFMHNDYGIAGTGTGVGTATLREYFSELIFSGNVLIGAPPANYPAANEFPPSAESAGFADPAAGDYRLPERGLFTNPEAQQVGVDLGAVCRALSATEKLPSCRSGVL